MSGLLAATTAMAVLRILFISQSLALSCSTESAGIIINHNKPSPKPVCDASKNVSVRYSSTSQRIYLESVDGTRGGCFTPSQIYEALGPQSPLSPLESPGEWLLSESLYVLDGIVLNVYGRDVGGDCDYLKLKSDSETIVNVRAHGGSLDFKNTKVTSWDLSMDDVDTNWADGRSYLSAISEVVLDPSETCEGVAKNEMGEARMDVEWSEIAYLGYENSESWGLSWKLRGICEDKSNRALYEGLGVYGNMMNSHVHHLYYGHYGYAQLNANLSGNSVHDNEVYGFDPHDDSVNITISHNNVYFNFHHGIIFSKYCHNTVVADNYVHDNGGVGIFPHYVSDNAVISHNTVEQNGDSGIAFLESSGGWVHGNTVRNNQGGIRFSVGSRNNLVSLNLFEDNGGYDVYQYEGNDPVVQAEDGRPTGMVYFRNSFRGSEGGLRLDDSRDTQFSHNSVEDWSVFELQDSENTLVLGNSLPASLSFVASEGSCLNAASDVEIGSVCGGTTAITDPFDQEYLDQMIAVAEESTVVVTQAPFETVVISRAPSPLSTSMFLDTFAPTAAPSGGGDRERGGVFSDDDIYLSMDFFSEAPTGSPTPSALPSVPRNGTPVIGDESKGARSMIIIYGTVCWMGLGVFIMVIML